MVAYDDDELATSLTASTSKNDLPGEKKRESTTPRHISNRPPSDRHTPSPVSRSHNQPSSTPGHSSSRRSGSGRERATSSATRHGGSSSGGGGGGGGEGGSSSRSALPSTAASASAKPDKRIGQYTVLETLGEGSFGKVKLAVHSVTNQKVALKIIARKKLISRDMAGRVEREIEYLQLLRHPHIIKLYTVIKTPTEIVMVLEYAGGELFDYIVQHGKMRESQARRFFQQIICAVEYCHRHKIVHRDLKPENLLLDEHLNVKIADFGLSNIMTDGNFLKTSCGSPNYAAPEVINGKLYAGPEVDVWSCGVILYVLLVGRLPFDDDHIPSLFAKIAKGQYVVPHHMSAGSAGLIKKCLAVSPVHRATMEDIRDDPWFKKDLPSYLQPPVHEFIDTGVDPSKAISPSTIAPNAPQDVQERLYNQVTEKISKTMGYGMADVKEALAADEPSAIKDAYLIVRENKLMEENPQLMDTEGKLLFQEPSPPPSGGNTAASLSTAMEKATVSEADATKIPDEMRSPLLDAVSPRSTGSAATDRSMRPYVSKIGVLPSSLPAYHAAFMKEYTSGKQEQALLSTESGVSEGGEPLTEEDQAENRARLHPHSRSQIKIAEAAAKPSGMTDAAPSAKKEKPTKWQFGIRSRNQPVEGIGYIYRALQKMGATWLVNEDWDRQGSNDGDDDEPDMSHSTAASGASLHHAGSMSRDHSRDRRTFYRADGTNEYRMPADPYVIHVRWIKHGLSRAPPREGQGPSTQTSSTNLQNKSPSAASMASSSASAIPIPGSISRVDSDVSPGESVVMHMDIQLYEMSPGVYLIDFKCAGYENDEGGLLEEKDVTSPFPFVDMASRLIILLAQASA